MIRYVIKRLLLIIPVVICVSFIVYALVDLAPGDIVDSLINETMTPEAIAELRSQYDLDKPMIYRYGKYMFNLIQGDLGISLRSNTSVWDTYMYRLPNTLLLAFSGLIIGVSCAIPLGIFASKHSGKIADNATTLLVILGISMPGFFMALLFLQIFAYKLAWLPAGGMQYGIRSLILPAICSGLMLMATATRQTRSSMLDVLRADYLRTARAKGVPEEIVIRKHALGNALIPIVTVIGTSLSYSLAGSVVIEQVFAWPGVGRMATEAVQQRDVPTVLGTVIMTAILYVLIQIIVDIIYAFVDPRIKAQYTSKNKKKKRAPAIKDTERPPDILQEPVAVVAAINEQDVKPETIEYEPALVQAETNTVLLSEPSVEEEEPFEAQNTFVTNAHSTKKQTVTITNEAYETKELVTKKYNKRSQFGEIFHRVKKNKGALIGLIIISIVLLLCLLSVFFINYEMVTAGNMKDRLISPSLQHPFGTDHLGRNMLLRVLYGSRYSLAIGFGGSAIAAILGVLLGAIAGYYGGKLESIIMRFADVLSSIPGLLLGMVIMSTLGSSLPNLILTVGITSIPVYVRMTRASILSLRNQEFVEAAKAIGLPNFRIIFRQLLPNGLSPIIVTFTMNFGTVILIAASLSFLGFGIVAPRPEWGTLISGGREYVRNAFYLLSIPGLFIMATVLAFNLLGDGLRDALDPKLKR